MNFRKLTSFWKRRQSTDSAGTKTDSADCSACQGSDKLLQMGKERDFATSFKCRHAAIAYIRDFVECGKNSEGAFHLSMHDIKHERDGVMGALELCIVTPRDSAQVSAVGSVFEENNSRVLNQPDAVPETAEDCGRQRLASLTEGSSESDCAATPHALPWCPCTSPSEHYTHEEQMMLLSELISRMFCIDRVLYATATTRAHQPRRPQLSLASSLTATVNGCSLDATRSRNGVETDELDATSDTLAKYLSASSVERDSTVELASHQSMTNNQEGEMLSFEWRRNEETMEVVYNLTTWVIMRELLKSDVKLFGNRNEGGEPLVTSGGEAASTLRALTEETLSHSICMNWDGVVDELVAALEMRQKHAVEAIISHWMLNYPTGRELVQCILQKKLPCTGGDAGGSTNINALPASVPVDQSLTSSNLAKETSGVVQTQEDTEPMPNLATGKYIENDFGLDDCVELVERLYQRYIVASWIDYLERTSVFSKVEEGYVTETMPVVTQASFFRMVNEYGICSHYWNEIKRDHIFRLLEKTWEGLRVPAVWDSVGGSNRRMPEEVVFTDEYGEDKWRRLSAQSVAPQNGFDTIVTIDNNTDVDMHGSPGAEEIFLPALLQEAWASVLYLRARQCLDEGVARLHDALQYVDRACSIPLWSYPFPHCQRAYEALVRAYVAMGDYTSALDVVQAHVASAEQGVGLSSGSLIGKVNHLKSTELLAEVQMLCPGNTSVNDTLQLGLGQARLCEQMVRDYSTPLGGEVMRYAELRGTIYRAKLNILKMCWLLHHRLGGLVETDDFFDQYVHLLRSKRVSCRFKEIYSALKERGEQLLKARQGSAVVVFRRAVDCVRKLVTNAPRTSTGTEHSVTDSSGAAASSCLTTAEVTRGLMGDMELCRVEAEGERNLALAYIAQADREVNVKERRQQLSNAVNCAYAAQNILQRWTSKLKSPISSTLMIGVASGVVVTAKALLRLGQPKKAALLLEPLIEEKANSTSIRPPLWCDAIAPSDHVLTAEEILERVDTLLVKLSTYDLHAQCLSKFDGERGFREVGLVRHFLQDLIKWALSHTSENFDREGKSKTSVEEGHMKKVQCPIHTGISKLLREAKTLQPVLSITCGDSLASLGRWEDALQEYSNALSVYSGCDEEGDCGKDIAEQVNRHTKGKGVTCKKCIWMMEHTPEHVQTDLKLKEAMVLAKLAEVYIALKKPQTAIRYYRQVLESSTEVGDALLQYNARIHLARLHTAVGESEEAAEQWSQVSDLAKVYGDEEIRRETTRNFVEAQLARGAYTDIIEAANELNTLATAVEGVGALGDRCFALETIADVHLKLGQYKECIAALDEREKVQYRGIQSEGALLNMRARALLGDGSTQEAMKVLMNWVQVARQQSNFAELGNANAALAVTYATTGQIFKAKRHHQAVLQAFSEAPAMTEGHTRTVMESARWLVHQFYLNTEEVPLCETTQVEKSNKQVGGSNYSFFPASQTIKRYDANSPTATSCASGDASDDEVDMEEKCVDGSLLSESGDLSVLLQEEMRQSKRNRMRSEARTGSSSSNNSGSGSYDGRDPSPDGNFSSEFNDCNDTMKNNSMAGLNMAAVLRDISTGINDISTAGSSKESHDLSDDSGNVDKRSAQFSDPCATPSPTVASPTIQSNGLGAPLRSRERVANMLLSPRAVVSEICERDTQFTTESVSVSVDFLYSHGCSIDSMEAPPHTTNCSNVLAEESPEPAMVKTKCSRRALETIEMASQLALVPLGVRQGFVPRNPADIIDLALLSFPQCTFVFYFADFATQYSAVLRPAGRSFFLECLVHPYTLQRYHEVHNTRLQAAEEEKKQNSMSLKVPCSSEKDELKTESDIGVKDVERGGQLREALCDLYADLWDPVFRLLTRANCHSDEAECLIIVADPTLLHIPFSSLIASTDGTEPLGQQYTVVVTPTVANFLKTMQKDKAILPMINAEGGCCYAFLPQGLSTDPSLVNGVDDRSDAKQRSPSLSAQTGPDVLIPTALNKASAATAKCFDSSDGCISHSSKNCDNEADRGDGYKKSTIFSRCVLAGCTRKELISVFSSPSCRFLFMLCDPVGCMFKVADGMVCLSDMTRGHHSISSSLDLVAVTSDCSTAPTAAEPGTAARLCLEHGCPRVLRIDVAQDVGVTPAHLSLLRIFCLKLTVTLEWGMRFPFALALRMAQEEALRCGYSLEICASFTLVGAA
uniref:Uncharacterized protein n=1 Tax=Trypanosoma congolense (strain IL3000) TaxID=1068625 RepID=G0UXY8_TRYCI|nr:conserved hypothetical protein [Trypanosoma congolense IL3000]